MCRIQFTLLFWGIIFLSRCNSRTWGSHQHKWQKRSVWLLGNVTFKIHNSPFIPSIKSLLQSSWFRPKSLTLNFKNLRCPKCCLWVRREKQELPKSISVCLIYKWIGLLSSSWSAEVRNKVWPCCAFVLWMYNAEKHIFVFRHNDCIRWLQEAFPNTMVIWF